MTASPFEEAGRARKVMAILKVVPTGDSSTENGIVADFLAGLSVPERAVFAKLAKVRSPSDETWRLVIEAVRARKPVGEVLP